MASWLGLLPAGTQQAYRFVCHSRVPHPVLDAIGAVFALSVAAR
jgi:hypothetical protein